MDRDRYVIPRSRITRVGDNYLDKPFKVGDRVILTAKGVETYGHHRDFWLGRPATIVHIPTERWNSNCVTAQWEGAETRFTVSCWALDWAGT